MSINWKAEKRKLSELTPAEYNPRQSNDKEWRDLEESLSKFNLASPIIINKNNKVIGGHFRLRILRERNVSDVDVRVPDRLLDPEEEKELNLRLNKNLGAWDFDKLANFEEDFLKGVGFESEELDKIFQLDTDKDADAVPEVRETIIKRGDIFVLGQHRLMCGDATSREDVERLMDGQKADMVFTDPPYGLGYQYNSYKDIQGHEYLEFCDKWYENIRHIGFIAITTGWKYMSLLVSERTERLYVVDS